MKNHRFDGAPVRRRRSAKEIATILREQRHSGLSLMAFAGKHQLCYSTLLRWRRQAPKSPGPASRERTISPGFIPVRIEAGSLSADYVLSWPGGRSLRIPPGFDPQALRRLLAALEEGE